MTEFQAFVDSNDSRDSTRLSITKVDSGTIFKISKGYDTPGDSGEVSMSAFLQDIVVAKVSVAVSEVVPDAEVIANEKDQLIMNLMEKLDTLTVEKENLKDTLEIVESKAAAAESINTKK